MLIPLKNFRGEIICIRYLSKGLNLPDEPFEEFDYE